MNNIEEEESILDISLKDIKKLGEILAQAYIEQCQNADFYKVYVVSGMEVITEQEAIEVINLDIISSSTAGIMDILGQIKDFFTSLVNSVGSWIVSAIQGFIEEVIKPILDAISGSVSSIWGFLTEIGATASEFLANIGNAVWEALKGAFDTITSTLTNVWNTISETAVTIGGVVYKGLTSILEGVGNVINQVGSALTGFINAILKFPEWFPKWFMDTIAKPISDALGGLASAIWNMLPDWLKDIFTGIGNFFSGIAEGFIKLIQDPIGWANTYIVSPLVQGLEWLGETIWNGLQTLGQWFITALQGAWEFISNVFTQFFNFMGDALFRFFSGMWNAFTLITNPIKEFFEWILGGVGELTKTVAQDILGSLFGWIMSSLGITPKEEEISEQVGTTIVYALGLMTFPLYGQLPTRLVSWIMTAIGKALGDLEWNLRINLRPLGLGVDTTFNFAKALGSTLTTFSKEMMEYIKEFGRGLAYGYAIWFTRPISRLVNYMIRNLVPVEIPREDVILEYARRHIDYLFEYDAEGNLVNIAPRESYAEVLKWANYFYGLYGYSDQALRWMFSYSLDDWISIYDRFGRKRNIPLSLVHSLPSASDLCRMMVRDIILQLDEFKRAMRTRGMTDDIAYLYYLLHFRYPPPERLWDFTTRGIAGLLWVTLTDEEKKELEARAKELGAFTPISPTELNFQAGMLLSALKTYMKWHDYARFSWLPNFTSDNLIYIDTIADIPTKIDQRWMVKWGIYELLSEKKVALSDPIKKFTTAIIENNPASTVTMNLAQFCRTLQATGLHPYWVVPTAIAESMNALADERTILRTGFINLFKEGFWNTKALETLLAGIIKASFLVAYFDTEAMKWKAGWVNLPVMFLPAERKLLELRALMDRSLDILRDTSREVSRAYSEWIIDSYDEYKTILSKVIEAVNKIFAYDYALITGTELPEEMKLQFTEEYFRPYVYSLGIWRTVFTIRRVRYWTQRFLGYVMYRLAYGVVSKEDADKIIEYVKQGAKLTDYEYQYLKGIAEALVGIAQREYAPTPSQLATICEIVPEAREFFDEVMTARKIPEEWQVIWAKYIDLKPVIDDIKKMYSRIEDLFVYFMLKEEDYKEVLSKLKDVGYTDKEIELLFQTSNYERIKVAWRELIGDVDRMTMLAEYSPKARDYAMGQLEKMIDALPIEDEQKQVIKTMWEQFIRLKPIMDEVRKYITELINDFVEDVITQEEFEQELEALREYGLDDYEIMFYKSIAGMKKARYLKRRAMYGG